MSKFQFVNFLTARIFQPPDGPEGQRRDHVRDHDGALHLFAGDGTGLYAGLAQAIAVERGYRRSRNRGHQARDADAIRFCCPGDCAGRILGDGEQSSRPDLDPGADHHHHRCRTGRTITVSYNANSINNFPILLGSPAWPIRGSSTAKASSAPNLNFYLVLDDSPSMAIGATQTDINNLITATARQPSPSRSCGFACHETHPNLDTGASASSVDNLTIARNNSITLRIDLVVNAVKQLMVSWSACPQAVSGGVMQCMSAINNTTYKAGLYTFDTGLNTLQSLTTPTAAGQSANNIQLFTVDHQNCVVSGCAIGTDYGTNIEAALTSINAIMPTPGLGSNTAGDTPGEVVFLVTDGVDDMIISSSSACNPSATLQTVGSQYRCQQPLNPAICTTIKNRGIRIAILYTEYLQLPTDSWYTGHIAQFNNPSSSTGQIAQNLQSCASPGLFADVQTGGDISAALTNLFIKVASSTASLTQ